MLHISFRLRIAKRFNGPDYIFELKRDGFRALAYIEEGTYSLAGGPTGGRGKAERNWARRSESCILWWSNMRRK